MDTTVLVLKTEFEATNVRQPYWVLGIYITINRDFIKLSQDAFVKKILEQFQMNDSHPTLLPINPNPRLLKENSVFEAEEHRLYQSIIGSYRYLVTSTRPNFEYPISYFSQFLAAPSKSYLMAAKCLLYILKVPKIYNCPFLSWMLRKLLQKDTPTLILEMVRILSKLFLVSFFRSTIR
jgi:hypothetical protein